MRHSIFMNTKVGKISNFKEEKKFLILKNVTFKSQIPTQQK